MSRETHDRTGDRPLTSVRWLLLLFVGCGGTATSTLDATVDGARDVAAPTLQGDASNCWNLHALCDVIMGLQDDAKRCSFGAPEPQCTQTLPHELLAGHSASAHQFGQCPLWVNDAHSAESGRFTAAAAEWGACAPCGCDLQCYGVGSNRLAVHAQRAVQPVMGRHRRRRRLIMAVNLRATRKTSTAARWRPFSGAGGRVPTVQDRRSRAGSINDSAPGASPPGRHLHRAERRRAEEGPTGAGKWTPPRPAITHQPATPRDSLARKNP
jgi:hypothetical protein